MSAGIVFDLDETLVNRRGSLDLYAGLLWSRYRDRTPLGQSAFTAVFHELDGNGRVPRPQFFASLSQRALNEVGPDQIAEHFRDHAWRSPLLFDGVVEYLQELKQRGYAIGIVTNGGSHSQNAKIANSGLGPHVDAFVISEEFGVKKPDPAIYHEVAARLGIDPEQSWFAGDYPISDVVGPASVGFRTAWVERYLPWPDDRERVYQQRVTHVSELQLE
jgi:putative hydrolase of the HAD superfamily